SRRIRRGCRGQLLSGEAGVFSEASRRADANAVAIRRSRIRQIRDERPMSMGFGGMRFDRVGFWRSGAKAFRTAALSLLFGAASASLGFAQSAGAPAGRVTEPHNWQLGFQQAATPVKDRIGDFHNELLIIITLITIFVMGLLAYVIIKFNARANPVPTRTTHNTLIEVIWTVVPVLILVIIAIPSFKLMYYMDRTQKADMTIKVTGHQWYWSYEYPDAGDVGFDSNIIAEKDLKPGPKRLLACANCPQGPFAG